MVVVVVWRVSVERRQMDGASMFWLDASLAVDSRPVWSLVLVLVRGRTMERSNAGDPEQNQRRGKHGEEV